MAFSPTGRNVMLDAVGAVAVRVSLHTADPGTTGTSEATGGSYGRQTIAWAAASAGSKVTTGTPAATIPVAAGTYTHFGLWSTTTGGVFYGGGSLSATETFAAAGEYDMNSITMSVT